MDSTQRPDRDSEQRQLAELARRNQRLAAMGEMAASLAHQIRTPLSAALLYAGNAARSGLEPARREQLLARTIDCLHDLEQLVGDMLQFTRESSRDTARLTLDELLDAVERSAAALLGAGQQLTVARPRQPLRLAGNREALAGALLNLVANALQAAGEAACIQLEARITPDRLQLRVRDNGPGMDAELCQRIFEPFFTTRPSGTGLGLAVARSVAEDHDGRIEVESSGAGGTTFLLELPLTGQPAAASRPTRRQAARSERRACA